MSVTGWLTDKRFLVGLAVGYVVLPRAWSKVIRPGLDRLKSGM